MISLLLVYGSKELDQGPAAGNLTRLDQCGPATSWL